MYAVSAIICSMTLLVASVQDWRIREVDDRCWLIVCAVGSAVLFIGNRDVLILLGNILLTILMLSEKLYGWRALPPAIAASACLMLSGDLCFAMVPVMYFSFYGMYCAGILRGGADAKALMSVAISFPFFPESTVIEPAFPAGYVFCPAFCTLVLALALTMASAVPCAIRNLMNGAGLTVSFTMDIDKAEQSFVWPVEDTDGCQKISISPCDDPKIYERLRNAGFKDVRVTWKIPFIIPIAVSFIMTLTVGSPLFLLV